ncbi:hypothetical protein HOC35_05140 [Candidatus Woesearchaeota archaeon]|jgi:hypothetical protein|nr:hypothetical protein [Candidatus Woesearchaeota archaeon]
MNNQKIKLNIFDRKYENEFHVINNTYKNFEEFLLKKGFLFTKGTNLGFWAGTPMKSMFEAFNILFEHDKLEKERKKEISFCDLGSGDGRVVLLASLFNVDKIVGIESDAWLHEVSLHIKDKVNFNEFSKTEFIRNDFSVHNIKDYDYVFIAPDRPFHRGLEDKFLEELEGKLIVHSNIFHPEKLKKIQEFDFNGEKFIVYEK